MSEQAEVLAAAKRLRTDDYPDDDDGVWQQAGDFERVARAALAAGLFQADDGGAVTLHWLESVQRKVNRSEGRTVVQEMAIGYHHGAKCHTVSLRSPVGQCDIVDVLVRADVRLLLAALKITKGAADV